jgi:sporulation protein YlmC with PRC-barrel domain
MVEMWTRILTTSALALALAAPAASQTTAPSDRPATAPAASGEGANFLTVQKQGDKVASELIGTAAVDQAGESVGKISDLILDQENKAIGAVVSIGGFLGIGSKLVGVPWQSVKVETKDGKPVATLSATRETLAKAPEFKTAAQMRAEDEALRARSSQPAPGTRPAPTSPTAPR